jgi:hypothetical protein
MGLDAKYQALPATSPFLAQMREEPLLWEEKLLGEYLNVSKRFCWLDRVWDVLHHLLSANRRDEAGTADDALMDAAIRGEGLISEHVRGGQGVPLRYTPPETVKRIAHLLELLPFNELVRQGHPKLMADTHVYRHPAGFSEEELRECLSPYFETLRAFYRAAASHGDGVLVSLD